MSAIYLASKYPAGQPALSLRGETQEMGRGDKRTQKGKRFAASYGNARPKKAKKDDAAAKSPAKKK